MEELGKTHTDAPYGWGLVAAAVLRWLSRTLRAGSVRRDARDVTLEVGLNRFSGPH